MTLFQHIADWYRSQVDPEGWKFKQKWLAEAPQREIEARQYLALLDAEMDDQTRPHDIDGHLPGDCMGCGAA